MVQRNDSPGSKGTPVEQWNPLLLRSVVTLSTASGTAVRNNKTGQCTRTRVLFRRSDAYAAGKALELPA